MKGAKYDPQMDTAEAAKRIRADIKAALKSGDLPAGLKVRVTTSRYSGGSSITIVVTAFPKLIHTRAYLRERTLSPHDFAKADRYTFTAKAALEKLEQLGNAYRRDDSDSMTDYFSCNFYLRVLFDGLLTEAEFEIAAELWPRPSLPPPVSLHEVLH